MYSQIHICGERENAIGRFPRSSDRYTTGGSLSLSDQHRLDEGPEDPSPPLREKARSSAGVDGTSEIDVQ